MSATFQNLPSSIRKDTAAWQRMFDASEPQHVELPGEFAEISAFEKLLIVRMIRPDKLVPAVRTLHSVLPPSQACTQPSRTCTSSCIAKRCTSRSQCMELF